jgi:hypothetical protein
MQSMLETTFVAMTDFDWYEQPASERGRRHEEEVA